MDSLNFNDGKWWEFAINFKLPHQGFTVGYDFYQPTKDTPAAEVYVYLGFFTLILLWGNENWIFDEEED